MTELELIFTNFNLNQTCMFIFNDIDLLQTYLLLKIKKLEITTIFSLYSLRPTAYYVITDANKIVNSLTEIRKSKNNFIFLLKEPLQIDLPCLNLNKFEIQIYSELGISKNKELKITDNLSIPIFLSYKYFFKLLQKQYSLKTILKKGDSKDNLSLNKLRYKLQNCQNNYLIRLYSFYYYFGLLCKRIQKNKKYT